MAITTEITTIQPASELPSGYTAPATTIEFSGTPIEKRLQHTIAVAGTADAANASTTQAAILAALKTYVDSTYIPNVLKLDATDTINGIIYVEQVQRKNNQSNYLLLGQDSYVITATLKYE